MMLASKLTASSLPSMVLSKLPTRAGTTSAVAWLATDKVVATWSSEFNWAVVRADFWAALRAPFRAALMAVSLASWPTRSVPL